MDTSWSICTSWLDMLCRKLVDTPFPFPWAQAVNIVLLMFSIGAPVVIVAHTTSVAAAVLITFAAVQTHIMLNEVRTWGHLNAYGALRMQLEPFECWREQHVRERSCQCMLCMHAGSTRY